MGVKSEKHVYRVRGLGRYRLVAAVGFVLFVVIYGGLLVILSGKQHHLSIPVRAVWIGVMLVGLFGFLAALVAGILMQTKLVLAPEGLSLRFMGMGNGAPWASFDRVDHVPIHGLYHEVDVLMLKVPMSGFGSKSAFRSGKRQIALTPYDRQWQEGAIGADLRRWAPHLFPGEWPEDGDRREPPAAAAGGPEARP